MNLLKIGKQGIRNVILECLVLWFAFKDRRVRWYAKIVILIPLVYTLSPVDVIPDALLVLGQTDDLIVIRISYALLKRIIDHAVLEECRKQAEVFLTEGKKKRLQFAVALLTIWTLLITLAAVYLIKKIRKHGHP